MYDGYIFKEDDNGLSCYSEETTNKGWKMSENTNSNNNHKNSIVAKLFSSFTDLESAIESAKQTLQKRGSIPAEVITRLDSYDTILTKQRRLATDLCEKMHVGDWDEVNRLVGLINGLSSMIRDDARAILSALALNSDEEPADSEKHFC